MTIIHIIRHGETEWNIAGRMQGHQDSPLTDKGRRQAIAARAGIERIDVVYSSPSVRAVETAKLIVGEPAGKINMLPGLMEINLGVWEGKNKEEVEENYGEQFDLFKNKPSRFSVEDGETFSEVQNRAVRAVTEIAEREKGKHVLVVTHTATIKVILAYFNTLPLDQLWDLPYVGNGSHSIIEHDESGNFRVTLYSGQTTW